MEKKSVLSNVPEVRSTGHILSVLCNARIQAIVSGFAMDRDLWDLVPVYEGDVPILPEEQIELLRKHSSQTREQREKFLEKCTELEALSLALFPYMKGSFRKVERQEIQLEILRLEKEIAKKSSILKSSKTSLSKNTREFLENAISLTKAQVLTLQVFHDDSSEFFEKIVDILDRYEKEESKTGATFVTRYAVRLLRAALGGEFDPAEVHQLERDFVKLRQIKTMAKDGHSMLERSLQAFSKIINIQFDELVTKNSGSRSQMASIPSRQEICNEYLERVSAFMPVSMKQEFAVQIKPNGRSPFKNTAVTIYGPPGIGKSSLVEMLCALTEAKPFIYSVPQMDTTHFGVLTVDDVSGRVRHALPDDVAGLLKEDGILVLDEFLREAVDGIPQKMHRLINDRELGGYEVFPSTIMVLVTNRQSHNTQGIREMEIALANRSRHFDMEDREQIFAGWCSWVFRTYNKSLLANRIVQAIVAYLTDEIPSEKGRTRFLAPPTKSLEQNEPFPSARSWTALINEIIRSGVNEEFVRGGAVGHGLGTSRLREMVMSHVGVEQAEGFCVFLEKFMALPSIDVLFERASRMVTALAIANCDASAMATTSDRKVGDKFISKLDYTVTSIPLSYWERLRLSPDSPFIRALDEKDRNTMMEELRPFLLEYEDLLKKEMLSGTDLPGVHIEQTQLSATERERLSILREQLWDILFRYEEKIPESKASLRKELSRLNPRNGREYLAEEMARLWEMPSPGISSMSIQCVLRSSIPSVIRQEALDAFARGEPMPMERFNAGLKLMAAFPYANMRIAMLTEFFNDFMLAPSPDLVRGLAKYGVAMTKAKPDDPDQKVTKVMKGSFPGFDPDSSEEITSFTPGYAFAEEMQRLFPVMRHLLNHTQTMALAFAADSRFAHKTFMDR